MYNFNITDRYYIGQYEGRPLKKYGSHLRNFINFRDLDKMEFIFLFSFCFLHRLNLTILIVVLYLLI